MKDSPAGSVEFRRRRRVWWSRTSIFSWRMDTWRRPRSDPPQHRHTDRQWSRHTRRHTSSQLITVTHSRTEMPRIYVVSVFIQHLAPPLTRLSNVHIQRITHLVASLDWFHLCAKGGGEVTVRPLSPLTHWDTCGGGVKPTCQCTLHNMSQNIPVRILYVPVYFDTKGTDSHNPKISTLNFN